jgi:outer membrane protein OmpA-like peptidoglycan-associated protein
VRSLWAIPVLTLIVGCAPKHDYPDGSGLVGQLNREVQALQQAVRALEYEAATCRDGKAPPDPLYQELHQILSNTDVGVERRGRTTIVTFPAVHLFGVDELSLRQEARMTLDVMSTALKLHPDYTIEVEGHTDDRGVPRELRNRFGDPFTFSAARAYALVATMVSEFGVSAARFGVIGRGSTRPIDTNETDAGQRHNRRVVMYIQPKMPPPEPQ